MQHKNPIDIELVNASDAAYVALVNICEYLDLPADTGERLRLKLAIGNARNEMRLQAQDEAQDLAAPLAPPASMD